MVHHKLICHEQIDEHFYQFSGVKTMVLELPVRGQPKHWPSKLSRHLSDFGRSDHYNFWKKGLVSLFITDTAEYRGVMKRCYHRMCDHPAQFSHKSYDFLTKHIRAMVKLSKEKCGKCSKILYVKL